MVSPARRTFAAIQVRVAGNPIRLAAAQRPRDTARTPAQQPLRSIVARQSCQAARFSVGAFSLRL